VFENEKKLLSEHGNQIITYERFNSEIDSFGIKEKAFLLGQSIWSRRTYNEIQSLIKKYSPDIAHVHNTFPLISWSAYKACSDLRVPVVQTLHHYRMICPGALLFRDGRVCEDCINGSLWNGVLHACYNESRLKTSIIALQNYIHKKLGSFKVVTCYLALNDFCKDLFIRAGVPPGQIQVKTNFLFDIAERNNGNEGYALYLGRISAEKDVETLILAWARTTKRIPLKIVGTGDQLSEMKSLTANMKLKNIEFLGYQPKSVCDSLASNASFLVIPSVWYETFNLVVREGFAAGKPVIVSDLGVLAEAVESGKTGLKFKPGDPDDLAEKVDSLIGNDEILMTMGQNARFEYEEKYTPEVNYRLLISIYKEAIVNNKKGQ